MSSDRRTQVIVFLDAPELGPRRPVGVLGIWPSLARKPNLPAQEIAFMETAVGVRIQ
jgi:hypothetical protein